MVSTTTSGAGHVSIGQRMRTVLPILTWGRTYPRRWLRADLVAGVTVAAFAIPEDMAYASMAGLQPQHGLYASLVSLLVYAAVGTSRQLAYGGTSALAIMLAGTLGAMTFTGPDQYLAAASLVAVLSGAMALVAWTLRLGFIANFVSESVLTGFSAGAALYIASSQLPKLFGIEGVQGNFFERVWNVLRHLGDTNGWSLGLGLLSLGLLLFLEARFHRLPTALIVVVAAIIVSWSTGLEDKGVAVAGKIPGGLPTPALPAIPADQLPQLVSLAFGAFLLSYIEGIGAAKTFAARYRERIDSNQELFANGVANIGAGLFQGYTVGGSMSRSAVNDSAGSKTPLAGAIASAVVGLVLLFLTAPFSHLPETTLAAIVFVAVRGLVNVPNIRALWHTSRGEFLAAAAAFGGVLVFGMLEGIIIGVLVTFVTILMRLSKPETSVLGLRPGTTDFVDVVRTPEAVTRPDVLVFRADTGWFYANAPVIQQDLNEAIAGASPQPRLVVLDLASAPSLDLGSVTVLNDVSTDLHARGIELGFANLYASGRRMLATVNPDFGTLVPDQSVTEVIAAWDRRHATDADQHSSPAGAEDA